MATDLLGRQIGIPVFDLIRIVLGRAYIQVEARTTPLAVPWTTSVGIL